MQLRNCSAEVNSYPVLTVVDNDRTAHTLHDAFVLTSYKSHVAVYSNGKLYLCRVMGTAEQLGCIFASS